MNLKPGVIRVLEREKRVCERAIARLRERYRPLERQYGWSTVGTSIRVFPLIRGCDPGLGVPVSVLSTTLSVSPVQAS